MLHTKKREVENAIKPGAVPQILLVEIFFGFNIRLDPSKLGDAPVFFHLVCYFEFRAL
jgi:hypothetical protein